MNLEEGIEILLPQAKFHNFCKTFPIVHILHVTTVFPTLLSFVDGHVSWNLELQVLLFLIKVTSWIIWVFRTKTSRSYFSKQTRILLLSPEPGEGGEIYVNCHISVTLCELDMCL
ncbi:hypothetical protein AMECASPLE_033051 [Ameca splendens]|uniref:Uncharacterized protein n=1 Tax=Ameca splendens TaxID=208324 RepID=A0ABV0ZFJ5_9TELE